MVCEYHLSPVEASCRFRDYTLTQKDLVVKPGVKIAVDHTLFPVHIADTATLGELGAL